MELGEAGGGEVAVKRQRLANPQRAHDGKARRIDERVFAFVALAKPAQRLLRELPAHELDPQAESPVTDWSRIGYDLEHARHPDRVHRGATARVTPGGLARAVSRRAGADNGLPASTGGPVRTRPGVPRGARRAASPSGRRLQSDCVARAGDAGGAFERCRADRRAARDTGRG